jgi:hypothetical protein
MATSILDIIIIIIEMIQSSIPKSQLFWGRFGSQYVEAAYDTNDLMLIFWKKSSVELPFSSFGDH